MDWRGPAMRGPPPADWRGPSHEVMARDWRGQPVGPHGIYPPAGYSPYGDRPPPRPMLPYAPGAWGHPQGIPVRPPEDHRYREPPPDWGGRGAPPQLYGAPRPGEVDLWRPPGAHGMPPPYGGGPPGDVSAGGGLPSADGRHPSAVGGGSEREVAASGAGGQSGGGSRVAAQDRAGVGANAGAAACEDNEERDGIVVPKGPQTMAERLMGVRLVRAALSQATLAKLRAAGVCGLDSEAATTPKPGVKGLAEEAAAAAAAKAKCARLGLDIDASKRVRIPPPMPTPPRLPVCTLDLKHSGLWEVFRLRCGSPAGAEAPVAPCELRRSRAGGSVLVPLVATGDSA